MSKKRIQNISETLSEILEELSEKQAEIVEDFKNNAVREKTITIHIKDGVPYYEINTIYYARETVGLCPLKCKDLRKN